MPLSEDEQRILQQIEKQFHADDPSLAGEIGRHSLYVHHLRRMKWSGLGFLAGVVIVVVALWFLFPIWVAFAGFAVMLGSALWFERNLRKLGREGVQRLSENFRSDGLRKAMGSTSERMRERFRRTDEE